MTHNRAFTSWDRSFTTRAIAGFGALSLGLALSGCAAERPVLYQSANTTAGDPIAQQQAIDECMALAQQAGVGTNKSAEIGKKTAGAAAVGGAAGAAAGAVRGNAGRGAAMGAAGAAAGSFTHALFKSRGLDGLEKRYVETCLRERGYKPLGWK